MKIGHFVPKSRKGCVVLVAVYCTKSTVEPVNPFLLISCTCYLLCD